MAKKTKQTKPKRSEVLWNAYVAEVEKEQEDSSPSSASGWKVFDAGLGVAIALAALGLIAMQMGDRPSVEPTGYQVEVMK